MIGEIFLDAEVVIDGIPLHRGIVLKQWSRVEQQRGDREKPPDRVTRSEAAQPIDLGFLGRSRFGRSAAGFGHENGYSISAGAGHPANRKVRSDIYRRVRFTNKLRKR